MSLKVKIIKDNAMHELKNNVEDNLQHYIDGTIDQVIKPEQYVEVPLPVDHVNLKMDKTPAYKTDKDNIRLLYDAFSGLSDSQAIEERLWAGLTHFKFLEYMRYRWPIPNESKEKQVDFVKRHYFFGHNKQRSLLTHSIARLWWYGRLLIDTEMENTYELLEYVSKDINVMGFMLFGSNFSNNPRVTKLFIKTIKEFEEKNNVQLKRDRKNNEYDRIRNLVNLYAGTTLLETLDDKTFVDKVRKYIDLTVQF